MRVLVVDDNKGFRAFMREVLKFNDCDVVEASDGFTALKLISEQLFDAVFLDIKMPRLNGLEVLKRIIVDNPALPIFLMSAYNDIELPDSKAYPNVYILFKPFELESLNFHIEKLVCNQRASSGV